MQRLVSRSLQRPLPSFLTCHFQLLGWAMSLMRAPPLCR